MSPRTKHQTPARGGGGQILNYLQSRISRIAGRQGLTRDIVNVLRTTDSSS